LLIKVLGLLLGEFDGEDGLDAGVQVEGFAGPAGSDRLSVGMQEAIHRSWVIMLGRLLLCGAAECEVKVLSETRREELRWLRAARQD
jgi:hypothetical protein